MKTKVLFILFLLTTTVSVKAQRSNIRLGYIDTEYILENIPEYQEALSQLDKKVQKWKSEIDLKLRNIEKKKEDLRNERVLLTKELIEEKEEEIAIEEAEIFDYQQKRFGPNGDLIIQKKTLIQPVQDQVLTAVQELAKAKKYDFIFDKSADIVMLYSNKRHDLSDYIVRSITRAAKRKQAKNRKSKKNAEEEDVIPVINKEKDERQRILDEKKAKRQKELEERKKKALEAREAKRKAFEERRKKLLEEREAKKNKNSNSSPQAPAEENNEENEPK
ncbi:OmpH family outer membrane protein [Pseudofulvibacter geojedonensis]|uniref:OmpH family outer membrane protein n=1 Tax=Pseudofulvibacter geojedonensis TaxID=1123758 RepID=A0ABW3I636_9FLAO